MQDSELEALLSRYRPADPPGGLEDRLLEQPALVFRDPRTWPWAVAAAALLAVTIGLHVAALAASSAGGIPSTRSGYRSSRNRSTGQQRGCWQRISSGRN